MQNLICTVAIKIKTLPDEFVAAEFVLNFRNKTNLRVATSVSSHFLCQIVSSRNHNYSSNIFKRRATLKGFLSILNPSGTLNFYFIHSLHFIYVLITMMPRDSLNDDDVTIPL